MTFPSLPDDLQAQLRSVLAASSHKADLRLDLDRFEGDGFPVDEYTARVLVERYPIKDLVSARIETKAETATTAAAEASENSEKQAEAFQNIAALRGALSGIGIHLNAELQAAGIDPEASGGVEAFLRFLDQHAERYLEAAKTRSPGSFVQIYETMEPLAAQNPDLTALLQRYETDYLLAQDYLANPDHDLGAIEDAKLVLGDSAITEIDGDIIRGKDGEKLDMSGHQMQLSLEGAGGLELKVATIERPDTRQNRLDITRKEQEIARREAEITVLEVKSEKYQEIASNLRLENPATFDSEDAQVRLVRQLLRSFPDLHALSPLAEATESGATFLRALTGFFDGEAEQAEQCVTVHRAEIATLRQDIGKLQAQIDAKRRLATEKIRDQKERVRATQAFYERLGVSRLIA